MCKFYLECGVVWLLYGHEIGGQGNIQGCAKFLTFSEVKYSMVFVRGVCNSYL